jgi:hypothetical protein
MNAFLRPFFTTPAGPREGDDDPMVRGHADAMMSGPDSDGDDSDLDDALSDTDSEVSNPTDSGYYYKALEFDFGDNRSTRLYRKQLTKVRAVLHK